MTRYILVRTFLVLPTLIGISLISFLLIHAAPGGPFEVALTRLQQNPVAGEQIPAELISSLKAQYGFEKPLLERYWGWLAKIGRLDLGESQLYRESVTRVIWPRFLRSALYAAWALPICYLFAFLWSVNHITLFSRRMKSLSSFLTALLFCLPPLILALSLKYIFGPGSFSTVVSGYVLSHLAMMALLFRGSLLNEHRAHYADVARAKGLSERQVIVKHTLKNAAIPIVTSLSYSVVAFFTGALFLEVVFKIDGLGMLSYKSALSRDHSLMMGIVLVVSTLFVLARWVSDLLYGLIDPRVRGEL